jgi:hypothetical protein
MFLFILELFIIVKIWNQLRDSSIVE